MKEWRNHDEHHLYHHRIITITIIITQSDLQQVHSPFQIECSRQDVLVVSSIIFYNFSFPHCLPVAPTSSFSSSRPFYFPFCLTWSNVCQKAVHMRPTQLAFLLLLHAGCFCPPWFYLILLYFSQVYSHWSSTSLSLTQRFKIFKVFTIYFLNRPNFSVICCSTF